MREIDHRDVETYVRSLISKGFGLQVKRSAGKARQRDEEIHTTGSSIPVQPESDAPPPEREASGRPLKEG